MTSLTGILLAAGGSRRLGRPKQLLDWRGEPLVRRAARAALDAGVDELVVVLGAHAEEVGAALDGLPLRTVLNPAWADGMGGSIARGARAIESGAVLVTLCDQPAVDASLLRRLIDGLAEGRPRVACRYAGGIGAPAVFSGPGDLERLRALEGDRGARALLAAEPDGVTAIDAPEAQTDIDDEGDWERFRGSS